MDNTVDIPCLNGYEGMVGLASLMVQLWFSRLKLTDLLLRRCGKVLTGKRPYTLASIPLSPRHDYGRRLV